jgi:predicted DNA-binding transcriptional regulator AlpA
VKTNSASSALAPFSARQRREAAALNVLEHFDRLPDMAQVRQPVVEALFGISPATVWRRVKDGRIPAPNKQSPGVTTWTVGALRSRLSAAEFEKTDHAIPCTN